MAVLLRPAITTDLERADELVCGSINELTRRHGFDPFARPSPPRFQAFSLQDDPGGLWVVEDAGRAVGFAFSWVCDELWFLAQLFVDPDQQGGGLGRQLLERTLAHAHASRCSHKALITFSFNRVSQALYMRHGLLPTVPIYFFSIDAARVMPQPTKRLRAEPLDRVSIPLNEKFAEIDRRAIGVSRAKHHGYLAGDTDTDGFALFAGTECVGYAYVSKTGHIGPLAVAEDGLLADAFETTLALAVKGRAREISAFVPSTARSAMLAAVERRMRITLPMLLMANDDFGHWTRYLPRNPGFM